MEEKRKAGRPIKADRNRAAIILKVLEPKIYTLTKLADLLGFNAKQDVSRAIKRDTVLLLPEEKKAEYIERLGSLDRSAK